MDKEKIRGNCMYCKEKAVAIVRGKRLCSSHFKRFKKGEICINICF
jgi:hypothetical protein